MRNFFDLKNISPKFKEFYERIELEKSSSIFGAVESFKIAISAGFKEKIVYITSDFLTANKCYEMFYNIYKERAWAMELVHGTLNNIGTTTLIPYYLVYSLTVFLPDTQ